MGESPDHMGRLYANGYSNDIVYFHNADRTIDLDGSTTNQGEYATYGQDSYFLVSGVYQKLHKTKRLRCGLWVRYANHGVWSFEVLPLYRDNHSETVPMPESRCGVWPYLSGNRTYSTTILFDLDKDVEVNRLFATKHSGTEFSVLLTRL